MLGRRCLSDYTQQSNCMALADGPIYRFGDFELDTRLHELRCDGVQRHVEPQVFDVLSYLFACRDRLVTKEELLEKVWGHRYVAPTTLNSRIKHARQAVGDDGDAQRVIRTVHGLSEREEVDVTFESWVRYLETVVDAVGLERFPLLGISQGCAVAIAYAVRHPERVTKLVLYGGFAEGVITRSHTQQQLDETTMVMRGIPLGWGHDNPAFRMFFAARFLPEGTPEQMRWFSDLQRVTTSPEIGARLLSTAALIDVSEIVPQVRAPTLVLHATGDAVASFSQGRKLAALIPGARFVPL